MCDRKSQLPAILKENKREDILEIWIARTEKEPSKSSLREAMEVEALANEVTDDEESELKAIKKENEDLKKQLLLSNDKTKELESEVLRLFDVVNKLKEKIETMEKKENNKKEEKRKQENENNEKEVRDGDENSQKNQKELTETFAQKAKNFRPKNSSSLARMIDPDHKPQVIHRRHFKVRFSGQALSDRRQQYSQTWRLLESMKIRQFVKQISLIGKNVVEIYVAEINLQKVEPAIKAFSFDPTVIPENSEFDLEGATSRRLGRLLYKTEWKNLKACILEGHSQKIKENAIDYAAKLEEKRPLRFENGLQMPVTDHTIIKPNDKEMNDQKNHGNE